MYLNTFERSCAQTIRDIFLKWISIQRIKLVFLAFIRFWISLITDARTHMHTDTHTDKRLKTWYLNSGYLKTCKRCSNSISKLVPKTIHFYCHLEEKMKILNCYYLQILCLNMKLHYFYINYILIWCSTVYLILKHKYFLINILYAMVNCNIRKKKVF